MADSLDKIKSYNTIDLNYFEIRGARTGVNNARSTRPLYVQGQFSPSKAVFDGTATISNGDTTVTGISFTAPFNTLNASILLTGDTLTDGSVSLSVSHYLTSTSVVVQQAPALSGTIHPTFRLVDREYLIEPDIGVNTTTGYGTFTSANEYVTGMSSTTGIAAGDSIQLNSYQVYFIVDSVVSSSSVKLTMAFTGTTTTGFYMTKRWRLNRLDYQYTENDFTYTKNKAKWTYDATTDSGLIAHDYYNNFKDGIQLKFSPTLIPTTHPDLMDSNVVLNKTLTKSTENPLYQYSLPAVPNPEESFQLYINEIPKDMFPDGDMDYVLHYWQTPTYEYPPPMAQRRIANVMPLQAVQNVTLNPLNTAEGIILFTDSNGKPVPGIMPGSETISFNGVDQTANRDYVLDLDTGVGYSSQHITNEAVVKYVAYEKPGLFDYGITFTLDSTVQRFTLPHRDTDQVLFEFESGRFKPSDKNNPAAGEEYFVDYLVEEEFISNEGIRTSAGMTWFSTSQYPIKFQGAIVSKNGVILSENEDYRVSYLTGRIVLFTPLVRGDTITISYSPLAWKRNSFTYENKKLYCKVYEALTPVSLASPPEFTLTNTNLTSVTDLQILKIRNVTKSFDYDLTGYILNGLLIHVQPTPPNVSIRTDFTDTILIDYKFANDSVENTPVQYINFFIPAGADYLAFIDQDVTSLFPADTFIRITDIETAGDYFFRVESSTYDGYDTVVQLYGNVPVDINNPIIYVSDAPIQNFSTFSQTASNIASGNTNIYFPGVLSRDFRIGQLMKLGNDYYYVSDVQYDTTRLQNVITLGVQTFQDYTTASILSAVGYSDCPIYYEGDTIISSIKNIIDDPRTPAMTLNYDGLVSVTSDSTGFAVDFGVDQSSFLYVTYPKVSQLTSALTGIGLNVVDYVPDWTSSKINPLNIAVATIDSTTLVTILPELRLSGTDTTEFTIAAGRLVLNNSLVRSQRYSLDYLGREPLDSTTVEFSASYFSMIPTKSKISASFKFDNLDQFYIQATSQRRFLDEVIQPQMREEAIQQSDSVGQGGDVPGDPDTGNSSGGLIGNEYRRVDAEITSRIFNTIFDFYNARVQTFADEIYASMGWKLCNSDGLINQTDETCATHSVSRIFPWADYTSFPPFKVTPLTGQAIPYATMGPYQPPMMLTAKAQFTPGSATVNCTTTGSYPTYWTKQLKAGDYIRPFDTTTDYRILSVGTDSQVTLDSTYAGSVTVDTPPAMTSKYPLYNDDGHTGGKIVGTISEFGLVNGDTFSVTVDGASDSYTFNDPPFPLSLLFPVSSFSISQIVNLLNANLSRTKVSYEWTEDLTPPFGYRSVIVLRTRGTYNKITIGAGSAMAKMGFTPGDVSFGNNIDPTLSITSDPDPEYPHTYQEYTDLVTERTSLSNIINAGYPNYINRQTYLSDATIIKNMALDESTMITTEMARINQELVAINKILLEPSMAGYGQTLLAYNIDTTYLGKCPEVQIADSSFWNFQDKVTGIRWIFDIYPWPLTGGPQLVYGKDTTGMGVPPPLTGSDTTIIGERTFFLHVDNDGTNDKRFLNTQLNDGSTYMPMTYFVDSSVQVDGSWNSGWDPAGSNQYSTSANKIYFELNDSTPMFILDYRDSSFAYQVDTTSMTLHWDTTRSKEYLFTTYPTIGSLKGALNTLAGITASGLSDRDGSSCYSIIQQPLTDMTPSVGVSFDKTSMLMFTMYEDSSLSWNYWVDATSLNLQKDTTYNNLLFATYPTILSLRTVADNIPGIAVTEQPAHDSSQSAVLQVHTTTAVGGSAPLYDQTYSLFTLTNDNVYNHMYAIDKSTISMTWDGSGKVYSYYIYTTVGAMRTAINADIPGINATSPSPFPETYFDSTPVSFKPIGITAIPPDASVYPALRPCYTYASTMDQKMLLDRSHFVNDTRLPDTSARWNFLNTRYAQVIQHIADEEHLRSIDGGTGNLYNWADNRFNRSNGCEARLKQIEKQIEMNTASLDVSKRFL